MSSAINCSSASSSSSVPHAMEVDSLSRKREREDELPDPIAKAAKMEAKRYEIELVERMKVQGQSILNSCRIPLDADATETFTYSSFKENMGAAFEQKLPYTIALIRERKNDESTFYPFDGNAFYKMLDLKRNQEAWKNPLTNSRVDSLFFFTIESNQSMFQLLKTLKRPDNFSDGKLDRDALLI